MSILSYLLVASVSASQPFVTCPSTISDTQSLVAPQDAKSVEYSKGPRNLSSMLVYEGHPSKLRLIRGDDWTSQGKVVYSFNGKSDIWVKCEYERSSIVLTYNPGKVSRCVYLVHKGVDGGGLGSCYR